MKSPFTPVVLEARNVHEALPLALRLLERSGVQRPSRNGAVLQTPFPVITVYNKPLERVLFWEQRDANPFLHLYESLWMLAGRNDIQPLLRYTSRFLEFSDDGVTQHAAYGHRWRNAPLSTKNSDNAPEILHYELDQLQVIINRLTHDPTDRRCVLQMWDANRDLGKNGKDFPCNVSATFQRDSEGALHLVVFCRSNDIIWGCYGANAVHFSFLLEYLALKIGCPVGTLTQVSVNWHAYENVLKTVKDLSRIALDGTFSVPQVIDNPYADERVRVLPMSKDINADQVDDLILALLYDIDTGFHINKPHQERRCFKSMYQVLRAHELYRQGTPNKLERYIKPLEYLKTADPSCDWVVAARQWLERRMVKMTTEKA